MITSDLASVILNKLNNIMIKVESNSGGSNSGGVQEFTSSGIFTVPQGVTKIWVTGCGAGGGGGGSEDHKYAIGAGGGGGGEIIFEKAFSVTPGEQIPITIGIGGAGGRNSSYSGSNGGNTVIGSLVTLSGGKGGERGYFNNTPYGKGGDGGPGAGGGGAGTGDYYGGDGGNSNIYILYAGTNGETVRANPSYNSNEYYNQGGISLPIYGKGGKGGYEYSNGGGGGGGGSLGIGGDGGDSVSGNGKNGTYGGGGGGASALGDDLTHAGGKGGNGFVRIEW